jgi:hypothetical protein
VPGIGVSISARRAAAWVSGRDRSACSAAYRNCARRNIAAQVLETAHGTQLGAPAANRLKRSSEVHGRWKVHSVSVYRWHVRPWIVSGVFADDPDQCLTQKRIVIARWLDTDVNLTDVALRTTPNQSA